MRWDESDFLKGADGENSCDRSFETILKSTQSERLGRRLLRMNRVRRSLLRERSDWSRLSFGIEMELP